MRRSSHRKQTKNSRWPLAVGLLIFFAFAFLGFIVFKILTLDKFIFVNKANDGSAEVIIVEKRINKTTKYLIPSETKLMSARGYGEYKLSSLWQLSEKDETRDKLITETITKNFSLPIYLWKNERKSNLNIYQIISALLMECKKSEYDYIITTKLPNSVLINFINSKFVDHTPKVDVLDLTGSLNTLDNVSKIIEVVGGKITLNSKGYDKELDCKVIGKKLDVVAIFSNIFSCDGSIDQSISTDLKIYLGAKFAERF